jgi:hypothetical protein
VCGRQTRALARLGRRDRRVRGSERLRGFRACAYANGMTYHVSMISYLPLNSFIFFCALMLHIGA